MGIWKSHNIGDLGASQAGQEVTLCGWVHTKREHGEILFILLRDRSSLVQVNIQKNDENKSLWDDAMGLKPEFCIRIKGRVRLRPEEAINAEMATGEIEIIPFEITILNDCKTLPFPVNTETEISESMALKYRYLQLRRPSMAHMVKTRHELVLFIRNLMNDMGFIEVETPLLTKSTPEGARDFLVPSRVYPGKFFALPQSPQQYKELLMVGGVERYFQFARCLRDEDARADRQAEHTQLDFEMSFVDQDDIISVLNRVFLESAERFSDLHIKEKPIPRITYKEAMNTYGTDKPDLRFSMELHDLNSLFLDSSFAPLQKAATDPDMTVHGIVIPEGGLWSRKLLDELSTFTDRFNGETLSWIAFRENEMRSSNAKRILNEETISGIKDSTQCGPDDLVLFAGGNWHKTVVFLGRIRSYMGKKLGLIDQSLLAFLFVVDFPQFEWNEDEQRLDPIHHMFVLPKDNSVQFLDSDPLSVLSTQVDAVCNGYELCSGSLRNHRRELQEKIMRLIGISEEDAETKFGHLLNALEYGAPPHGGAAPGLDRLLMVLLNTERMSDVVVFPKTYSGRDLLMDAPSDVSLDQLHDLHLSIIKSERTEA